MRKILFMLCLSALITGCTKSGEQKATLLLSNTELKHNSVLKLDSVIEYPEAFDKTLKAIELENNALEKVAKFVAYGNKLSESERKTDEFQNRVKLIQEEAISLINSAKSYKEDAAMIGLKSSVKGISKNFLGWKYTSKNDSCIYVVYFDKKVATILGIDKTEL